MDFSNRLKDIDVHQFSVVAFCNACGRSHTLRLADFAPGLRIPELDAWVSCPVCGSRDISVRIDSASPSERLWLVHMRRPKIAR